MPPANTPVLFTLGLGRPLDNVRAWARRPNTDVLEGKVLDRKAFITDPRQHFWAKTEVEAHPSLALVHVGVNAICNPAELFLVAPHHLVY